MHKCCSIAFIETNASTKYYTLTTKYTSYSERPNIMPIAISYSYGCHRLNVANTSQSARMPRFLLNTAIYVSKIGPKTSQKSMALLPIIGQIILEVYTKFYMSQPLGLTILMYLE